MVRSHKRSSQDNGLEEEIARRAWAQSDDDLYVLMPVTNLTGPPFLFGKFALTPAANKLSYVDFSARYKQAPTNCPYLFSLIALFIFCKSNQTWQNVYDVMNMFRKQ
ncbi:hypothetical protein FQR65_LT07309 [Abscondita terminalis]|nr:hypothetical protein FQR65_LT07309 [Abscondita terminalis]